MERDEARAGCRERSTRLRLIAAFYSLSLLGWIGLLILALDHPSTPPFGALNPAFDAAFWRTLCAALPVG
jgi:hypothetical protein